jgi:hypothetical protein
MNHLDSYPEQIIAMGKFLENMEKLKPLPSKSIEHMQESEFENLENLYEGILGNLEGFPLERTQWRKKVFPLISQMSSDLKMIVDDLIWVFPNSEELFEKKGESWIESVAENPQHSVIIMEKLSKNMKELYVSK